MASGIAQRGNYSHLFGTGMLPVLEEIFWSRFARHPMRRDALFKKVASDRDIWQATEMHDMPLFAQVAEGSEYSFDRPKQGASKTFSAIKYGRGFSITREMVEDGKFDFIADAIQKLAKSAEESQEISAMNVFNNGFSSELAADGLSVFNAAHTLPSGLTFRNKLAANADLSQTSLQTAIADFETQFIGDSGIIEKIVPKVLLVHSSNRLYAKELVGSDLKPDTADNNLNAFRDEGLMVISSPHLTDTDAWFLVAAPEDTGLRIINRQALRTESAGAEAVGFMSDSMFYKASYRESLGVTHAKGLMASPGAP